MLPSISHRPCVQHDTDQEKAIFCTDGALTIARRGGEEGPGNTGNEAYCGHITRLTAYKRLT